MQTELAHLLPFHLVFSFTLYLIYSPSLLIYICPHLPTPSIYRMPKYVHVYVCVHCAYMCSVQCISFSWTI